MTKKEQEEIDLLKELIALDSTTSEDRETFQKTLSKYESQEPKVEKKTMPKKAKATRKPKATPKPKAEKPTTLPSDVDAMKKAIKERTGKTEAECEDIISQYRILRNKSKVNGAKRIAKLKSNDELIAGTNVITPVAQIEKDAEIVKVKIEKQVEQIENKAEREVVTKDKTKDEVKVAVEKKVIKELAKLSDDMVSKSTTFVKNIQTELKKVDKTEAKNFLLGLRNEIDALLSKFGDGGSTIETYNITQNESASSVNPSKFARGGGVKSNNNSVRVKALIKNLDNTPYSIGLAILRERLLTYTQNDLKIMEKNPNAFGNFFISDGMYKDYFDRVIEELKFDYEDGGSVDDGDFARGGGVGKKYILLGYSATASRDTYEDGELESVGDWDMSLSKEFSNKKDLIDYINEKIIYVDYEESDFDFESGEGKNIQTDVLCTYDDYNGYYPANEEEKKLWKKGKKELYNVHYFIDVQAVIPTSYATGGNINDIDYNEILDVLKEKLEDSIQELPMDYENADNFNGEEVEKNSRDGFIAYTNGGYEVTWFEYISQFSGSGKSLPTSQLDDEMQRQVDYNYEIAKERFIEEYAEIVEELGVDNIDYSSLEEAGYESEAEQLSEWEMDYDGDDTILCEIGAYYYDTENYRGIEGKNTIRLYGLVNLESPYHRRGNLDDSYDIDITFDSISELKEKIDAGLKEIINWFDGKYYKDSNAEMKITRMADGGEVGEFAMGGQIKVGDGEDKGYLLGYEPYFEKYVWIASIDEDNKIVRATHGYFPKHPLSKKAINWAKRNGYDYMADGKKYDNGGLIGNQKSIDLNENGKIDAEDFKLLRSTRNGAWRKEHKYVNSTSRNKKGKLDKTEVRYAKKYNPSRTGYKGKTNYAKGGMIKPRLKKGDDVLIIGRRWFDKVNGNTYHTAELQVNGNFVAKSGMQYGYGDNYVETGKELLLQNYKLPIGFNEKSHLTQLRDKKITFRSYAFDGLKRDLAKGGGIDDVPQNIKERLEYLRGEIRSENISYEELMELQSLAQYIEPNDVELLEPAGVPEFEDDVERNEMGDEYVSSCNVCGNDMNSSEMSDMDNVCKSCSYAKGGKVGEFKNIMENNIITEKEVNLIKMRMNNNRVDESTQEVIDYIWDNSPQLTPDQNKKGIDYLRNLWKSPTGKERTNNPFGYREQETLDTFEYFELRGFYDAGNYNNKFYVPLYNCVGADSSFEYAFYNGKVNILG